MENKTLKIKCPNCGSILTIRYIDGLDTKSITCPKCNIKTRFVDYFQVVKTVNETHENHDEPDERATNYGKSAAPDHATRLNEAPEEKGTAYVSKKNMAVGKLVNLANNATYSLSEGVNTIGRMAQSSTASLQIDTDDRTMSRSHARIDVVSTQIGMSHFFMNDKNKNETFVNSQQIGADDRILLSNGDIIQMGKTRLRFVIIHQ
jgi:pSer/pThr/pTyr-binding forkhead associated (FHA) protein